MPNPSKTPLLDRISTPDDLRKLPETELKQVAAELRAETIDAVSVTGGHLGAGLGVVELTVAIHHVFDTPRDRLIWDVGHQAYPHKILTGRRDRIRTLRQGGGLSGFTKRSESEYDPFGAAHSSTSISAGLGMAVARDLDGRKNNVIAVIGDGAMSAGMAFEAMNNAGAMHSRLIVILNDNDMSIAPPVGAMSAYLAKLSATRTYLKLRDIGKQLTRQLPEKIDRAITRAVEHARGYVTGGTLFEELGFYYVGPIDGHNLDQLLPVLKNVRDADVGGPALIHVVTQKGKGYEPAENAEDKYHGVNTFDVVTGAQSKPKANAPSYTRVFADALIKAAREDDKIVAVTAAMPSGTGLDFFGTEFPKRTFDVGIAEQHAVTFAAGLATEGYKPFCAIYSTFLQRAYDQVMHDVSLQKLPVRFAIDRAGLVGADGATHAGSFDIAYLGVLPEMTIMAAADEAELVHMVATAAAYNEGPIAFRYPRGEGVGVELPTFGKVLEIGKGRVMREGTSVAILSLGTRLAEALRAADEAELVHMVATAAAYNEGPIAFRYPRGEGVGVELPTFGKVLEIGKGRVMREGTSVAILSLGTRLAEALRAADQLSTYGLSTTVADARFAKPLDRDLVRQLAKNHEVLITIEEGSVGGFGSFVMQALAEDGALDGAGRRVPLKFRSMVLPDMYQDHDKPERLYAQAGLDAKAIVAKVLSVLGREEDAAKALIA